jgi:CheY-like chemotaxis protein
MTAIKKILVVEDDPFISELYVRALKKAGYEVTLTTTGTEGLEIAKKDINDLMLLDIMVPEITGMDILSELRSNDSDPNMHMKIFITTNLDQDDDTRNKVEKMADGYIIKADITPKNLIQIISKIEI